MKNKKEISEKMEQEKQFEEKESLEEAIEEVAEAGISEEPEDVSENEEEKSPADEYLDGWKRCQADFENYKKRQAESQKDLIRYSTQNIILQILPVIDNFHASTSHIPEDQKTNSWVTGIMYIQKQLEQVLTDNDVTEIETKIGDNFDPVRHEAVEDMDCKFCKSKDYKFKNKIKKIVTRSYQIENKIIRASRVIVE